MQLTSVTKYLAYPANLASIIFIAFASILFSVAGGIFGLPLAGDHAHVVLQVRPRDGRAHRVEVEGEPVLSVEMLNPIEQPKSIVLLIITGIFFAILYAALYWLGPISAPSSGSLAVGLLPAMVAVQTAADSALLALNPVEWSAHSLDEKRLRAGARRNSRLLGLRGHAAAEPASRRSSARLIVAAL